MSGASDASARQGDGGGTSFGRSKKWAIRATSLQTLGISKRKRAGSRAWRKRAKPVMDHNERRRRDQDYTCPVTKNGGPAPVNARRSRELLCERRTPTCWCEPVRSNIGCFHATSAARTPAKKNGRIPRNRWTIQCDIPHYQRILSHCVRLFHLKWCIYSEIRHKCPHPSGSTRCTESLSFPCVFAPSHLCVSSQVDEVNGTEGGRNYGSERQNIWADTE